MAETDYGRAATRRPLVRESLDLRRRSLPAGHPDIADALYELGWIAFGAEQDS